MQQGRTIETVFALLREQLLSGGYGERLAVFKHKMNICLGLAAPVDDFSVQVLFNRYPDIDRLFEV
ncbi:hypothetical protein D3C71_1915610 [compost metagenome]